MSAIDTCSEAGWHEAAQTPQTKIYASYGRSAKRIKAGEYYFYLDKKQAMLRALKQFTSLKDDNGAFVQMQPYCSAIQVHIGEDKYINFYCVVFSAEMPERVYFDSTDSEFKAHFEAVGWEQVKDDSLGIFKSGLIDVEYVENGDSLIAYATKHGLSTGFCGYLGLKNSGT